MTMKRYIGVIALGISAAALAQSAMPTFEEVDVNADGQISATEAQVIEGLDFATLDVNQDGSLSREEYTMAHSEE
jgi:EF hand